MTARPVISKRTPNFICHHSSSVRVVVSVRLVRCSAVVVAFLNHFPLSSSVNRSYHVMYDGFVYSVHNIPRELKNTQWSHAVMRSV